MRDPGNEVGVTLFTATDASNASKGWIMAELAFEGLVAFPVGYILDLGGGFPITSYPFSETRFSEATAASHRDSPSKSVVPFDVIFSKAIHCMKLKGGTTEEEKKAYQRLDQFLKSDVGVHAWAKASNEKEFNAIFASKVIIPLTGSTCIINYKPKNLEHHENLKLPQEYGVDGLVISHPKSYHGELDMVVIPPGSKKDVNKKPNTVPVTSLTDDRKMDVDPPQEDERDDRYEPEGGEKDDSPGKTMVEGKILRGSSARYHQSIAALLTFSKIQKSRHENNSWWLQLCLVPNYK